MRVVYLAAPVRGNVAENVARAKRWLAWAWRIRDIVPIAPWLTPVELFAADADDDAAARELGLTRDCAVVAKCDELWLVGGRISDGMRREWVTAMERGVKVQDLTGLGDEPPGES